MRYTGAYTYSMASNYNRFGKPAGRVRPGRLAPPRRPRPRPPERRRSVGPCVSGRQRKHHFRIFACAATKSARLESAVSHNELHRLSRPVGLASASPRRRELLLSLGLGVDIIPSVVRRSPAARPLPDRDGARSRARQAGRRPRRRRVLAIARRHGRRPRRPRLGQAARRRRCARDARQRCPAAATRSTPRSRCATPSGMIPARRSRQYAACASRALDTRDDRRRTSPAATAGTRPARTGSRASPQPWSSASTATTSPWSASRWQRSPAPSRAWASACVPPPLVRAGELPA